MSDKRDDANLISLCCPHCKTHIAVMSINLPLLQRRQLAGRKCSGCQAYITTQQIDDAYREYPA